MPEKRILEAGEILFVQGDQPQKLYMLQEGALEILQASGEYVGLDHHIIADKSARVGTVAKKSMLIGYSSNLLSPYNQSMRAVKKSLVIEYPLGKSGFKNIAVKDFTSSVNILRQLYNLYLQSVNNLKKYYSLSGRIQQLHDNLLLLYHSISLGTGPEEMNLSSEKLYEIFRANGGTIDDQIPIEILIKDFSPHLEKKYGEVDNSGNLHESYDQLVRNLLKVDGQILAHTLKGNPMITVTVFEEYTAELNRLFISTHSVAAEIEEKLNLFFDEEDSWSSYFCTPGVVEEWLASERIDRNFFPGMAKLLQKLNEMYLSVFGKGLNGYENYGKLLVKMNDQSGESAGAAQGGGIDEVVESGETPAQISTGLNKSIYQIFEFSMIDQEFQKRMLKLLNDFKNLKAPFSTEGDARKVRRFVSKMYWDLYKQVFVRTKTESSIPRSVKLMMNFGFLDNELLDDEQLKELNELARMRDKSDCETILGEYDFLSKIYEGKEEPSITEMGLNYEGYIREQNKYKKRGEEIVVEEEDILLHKTLYEIDQRLASTAAVCSGGSSTAFPILTSEMVKGSLKNLYVKRDDLCKLVKKIEEIDFSVFYRETVLKMDEAREIIQEEIVPYFIMLPIYGTKSLLWQEIIGNNKRSRGRIVIPTFFMGDLEKSFLHTIACFRWELIRTVKGAMWADPIEGGLTGEYFDFVNTYKKNTKLSAEAKDKIKSRFRALRTNRDRFADDYITWISYERDGIMKLNSVVREMFYKHMPFNKDIRARLENMPAFTKFANRFTNVKNREIAAYERRYKKYQDDAEKYPLEIEKFFEFLKK